MQLTDRLLFGAGALACISHTALVAAQVEAQMKRLKGPPEISEEPFFPGGVQ